MLAIVIINILRHTLGLEVWEFWVKGFERRSKVFNEHGSFLVNILRTIQNYKRDPCLGTPNTDGSSHGDRSLVDSLYQTPLRTGG